MPNKKDSLSLITLKGGAAIEMFDFELQKVLDNIMDPNTVAEAVREITLKVKIKPDKDRTFGPIAICPSCKLAPQEPVMSQIFFGQDKDGAIAHEYAKPVQNNLFDDREPPVSLAEARKEAE